MFDIEIYRLFSDVLLRWACGTGGRDENDPVYKIVTEGRDVGKFQASYSSCGDLAHWLHFRLGIRGSWVNRQEFNGWRSGLNVSKLAFSSVAKVPRPRENFESGDVGIIWNNAQGTDAHVLVIREPGWSGDPKAPTLATAEYGQPGGALKTRNLSGDGLIGKRKLQKVILLETAIKAGAASGLLVNPDKRAILEAAEYLIDELPGEILDTLDSALALV
jgi:hypothetical protein